MPLELQNVMGESWMRSLKRWHNWLAESWGHFATGANVALLDGREPDADTGALAKLAGRESC